MSYKQCFGGFFLFFWQLLMIKHSLGHIDPAGAFLLFLEKLSWGLQGKNRLLLLLLPLLQMAVTDRLPAKHNRCQIFHSPPLTAADFQSSTFPQCLYSPTLPLHTAFDSLQSQSTSEGTKQACREQLSTYREWESLCQSNTNNRYMFYSSLPPCSLCSSPPNVV